MSWEYRPAFDAAHRAAMQAGKSVLFVCPPAAWAVVPLLGELPAPADPGCDILVLVPDITDAVELADALAAHDVARPAHAVTGLARTQRLLTAGAVRTAIATPADALELVRRAALKAESLRRVVVGWPDRQEAAGQLDALELVLAEARDAARLVATADPDADGGFIERHARRAPLAVGGRLPPHPGSGVRYAVTDGYRLGWTVQAVLNALNPTSAILWDPTADAGGRWRAVAADASVTVTAAVPGDAAELAVAVRLPSAEALDALRAVAREVVVLVRPTQLAYTERLARPLRVVRLPSEADRARDAAHRLRAGLRDRAAQGSLGDALLALAPLFDEFDPALVAAAAIGATEGGVAPASPAIPADVPAWIVLRLNAGRRDRLRPADIVGVLLNVVGLAKDQVGLIDIRDAFSLVYVRAETAERARAGLDGAELRGRSVKATLDRR